MQKNWNWKHLLHRYIACWTAAKNGERTFAFSKRKFIHSVFFCFSFISLCLYWSKQKGTEAILRILQDSFFFVCDEWWTKKVVQYKKKQGKAQHNNIANIELMPKIWKTAGGKFQLRCTVRKMFDFILLA